MAVYSVEDERFPVDKNYVRADLTISGYLFEKIDENNTKVTIGMNFDPKGSIPKYIVN